MIQTHGRFLLCRRGLSRARSHWADRCTAHGWHDSRVQPRQSLTDRRWMIELPCSPGRGGRKTVASDPFPVGGASGCKRHSLGRVNVASSWSRDFCGRDCCSDKRKEWQCLTTILDPGRVWDSSALEAWAAVW